MVIFAYNNGYHAYIKKITFEYLYSRMLNIPISCDNLVDRVIIGPELLRETEEQVVKLGKNFKVAHERHKNYVYKERTIK